MALMQLRALRDCWWHGSARGTSLYAEQLLEAEPLVVVR